jgi:Fic/DOC family
VRTGRFAHIVNCRPLRLEHTTTATTTHVIPDRLLSARVVSVQPIHFFFCVHRSFVFSTQGFKTVKFLCSAAPLDRARTEFIFKQSRPASAAARRRQARELLYSVKTGSIAAAWTMLFPLVAVCSPPAGGGSSRLQFKCGVRRYRHAIDQDHIPPLVAIGAFILDFLCIHPFRDGNGRVSRLLTFLALYQHGYEVGRYISLERLVEEAKEDYYHVLQKSSQRWHDSKHDLLPWLNHFLAIARRAYGEFEQRAGDMKSKRGAKTELVDHAIESNVGEFGITDLERACPGVSRDMIRLRLRDLKAAGRIECLGRGPGAKWRKRVISLKEGKKEGNKFPNR